MLVLKLGILLLGILQALAFGHDNHTTDVVCGYFPHQRSITPSPILYRQIEEWDEEGSASFIVLNYVESGSKTVKITYQDEVIPESFSIDGTYYYYDETQDLFIRNGKDLLSPNFCQKKRTTNKEIQISFLRTPLYCTDFALDSPSSQAVLSPANKSTNGKILQVSRWDFDLHELTGGKFYPSEHHHEGLLLDADAQMLSSPKYTEKKITHQVPLKGPPTESFQFVQYKLSDGSYSPIFAHFQTPIWYEHGTFTPPFELVDLYFFCELKPPGGRIGAHGP